MSEDTITQKEFDLLRGFIASECGITLGDEKMYLIENRLAPLLAESGCESFEDFYHLAKREDDPKLKTKIIDAMTTNETLWFRDDSPYQALREKVFPDLLAKIEAGEKNEIRIWSAACSTGQEPYSIVLSFLEHIRTHRLDPALNERLSVLATDISKSVLFLAQTARYNPIAMSRGMPADIQDRYFEAKGRIFILSDEVKKRVKFQNFNLMESFTPFGSFDLVFLRYVAIYFSEDFKRELFAKIARVLNPGGYLVLGASESLMGLSSDYDSVEMGRAHFYQAKN